MKRTSVRTLLGSSFLLLLAACADQGASSALPPSEFASEATNLGGSSRIPHKAELAGEGEGYGTVQPSAAQASMDTMSRETGKPTAKASMPETDHGAMDHGKIDHGSMLGMNPPSGAPQVAQAAHVQGSGTINAVDPAGHKINLSHNAIPAIGWPAMTMDFDVAPSLDLAAIKPGTRVNFMMQLVGGMYVVHSITPAGGQ